jgi:hypothetical protein
MLHGDGDIYEGEWAYDMANGVGEYIHATGGRYKGQWVNDQMHGNGVEEWPDGSKYEVLLAIDLNECREII